MIASLSKDSGKVFSITSSGFIAILVSGAIFPLNSQADVSNYSHPAILQKNTITANAESFTPLTTLITEALENNPKIQARFRSKHHEPVSAMDC